MKLIVRLVFRLILFPLCLLLSFACSYEKNSSSFNGRKFKWDFKSQKVYKYSFEQRSKFFNNSGGGEIDTAEHTFFGEIAIISKGKDKADFKISISERVKQPYLREQTKVCQNMNDKGGFNSESDCIEFMGIVDLLFPLPYKNVVVGEKEKRNLKFPIKRLRTPGYVMGHYELEYVQDIELSSALLRCQFKADSLTWKGKVKGKHDSHYSGKAEYIFNYTDGYFASVEIDFERLSKSQYLYGEKIIDKSGEITEMDIKFLGIE